MVFRANEILIYTDLLNKSHEVRYIETSTESGNHKVLFQGQEQSREIWLRSAQLQATGRIYEQPISQEREKKAWVIGDPVPEHLIKPRGRRKT